MNSSQKLTALILPFLGLIIGVAIFLDGALAVAAQPSLSAPINKQTTILEVTFIQSSYEMATSVAAAATCTISPTKILPVGDSITSGQYSSHDGGYRLPLYLSLRNAGRDIEFVGSEMNGPTPGFDYYHEGHPGIETFAVTDAMNFYLANNDPDYVLLHLGTNDMRKGGLVTETVIPEINDLLDEVDVYELSVTKTVTVVVAQIVSEACGSPATPSCSRGVDNTAIYNQALQELVDARTLAGDNLILVDMENGAGLDYAKFGGDFADELHPNDGGYAKMAVAWFDALATDLPAACATPPLILGDAVTETAVSNRYTHQITASGEPTISFSLNITSPTGMSIDPVSGLISWIPSMAQLGSNNVGVLATSNAGTDIYDFNINVINGGVAVVQEPHEVTLLINDPLTFTVYVTNTGSFTLTDVPVTFPLTPSCDFNPAPLAPGEASFPISCFIASVTVSATHAVYITATDSLAVEWSAMDSSSVTVIDPQIAVVKTAVSPTILYDSTATYTVTVTNMGDVDLTNVEVVDSATPNCSDATIGTLLKGQSVAYGCSFDNATANIFSTATVTGTHEMGQVSDSDSDTINVINPSIDIIIMPDSQPVLSGSVVTFTVSITNTGDTTLTNISVADTAVPNCVVPIPDLIPNADYSYDCTISGVSTDFYNSATVTGDHMIGQVSANDSVLVDLFSTDIAINMVANEYALTGSDVDFNITITNTSGTDMSDVTFTDSATGCSVPLPTLVDGATYTDSCTALNVTADITNTINVTGTLPGNVEASNSDIAIVYIIDPAIEIMLTPATQEINVGETALFTVTVTNMGDIELTNVQVTSAAAPDCDNSLATIAAQATVQYMCELSGATDDLSNTVVTTGTHPLGTVMAEETAVVDISGYTLFLPILINP